MYRDLATYNSGTKGAALTLPATGRITALWGLSEAALGGILHALRIPFTGLFIGGAAVVFISLLAYYSQSKREILKATFIVILIKATVSPHTPLTAYFAVMVQGFLGYVLFNFLSSYKISSLLLGILSLTLSSLQKLIVLTILFGENLWDSIDIFFNFILERTFGLTSGSAELSVSYFLIGFYMAIHLTGGIIAGLTAAKMPEWIKKNIDFVGEAEYDIPPLSDGDNQRGLHKKKRFRIKGKIILSFMVVLAILSYLYPELGESTGAQLLIMAFRVFVIMILWYSIISPLLLNLFKRFLDKGRGKYSIEIKNIMNLFPMIKSTVKFSWIRSSKAKGLRRIQSFLILTFVLILVSDRN